MNSVSKFEENRAQLAYGSALFVKKASDTDGKYYLLLPGETTPFVVGSNDTVEFDILQSPTKGKLMGKATIDDKEVEFMLHRDNVYRIEQFLDQTLDFLSVTPDGLGYKATGEISYRANDGTSGDPFKGTFTIVCKSADKTAVMDIRDMVKDTVLITNAVPYSLDIGTASNEVTIEGTEDDFTITTAVKNNDGDTVTTFTATAGSVSNGVGKVTISKGTGATAGSHAILYITVSKTGLADWTTTILLNAE
jgi:hypothetical protein